ncbi:MAG TPA: DNA primase [Dehalococcoidia bacterium]|jgi:DNA primase|nr:DNA primase [Dehalococcoidia bacterium]
MSSIEDVKQRIDIVDLVSQYVTLKKAGRGFTGLCPFHSERTPSFHVDPARQTWHCFGACGTGGDIFQFVMKKDGIEFREALRMLAERAGVELDSRRNTQEDSQRARLHEINEAAAAFFHASLLESDRAGAARAYVAERRLADASVEQFQIGYAPNSWDALLGHLAGRGFDAKDVRNAGLAVEGDRGVYDRFRHRLMFPIRDDRGRIAGFGGRMLPGEALGGGDVHAKYVNTPQTPAFDKGALLYALDLAKDAIRAEGAVIVEGYMDVIAAHEHGFTNVIASMGTALTERQVTLLKRYTRSITLALDADAAGSEATLRGVRVVADAVDREGTPLVDWRGVIRHQETLAADIRVLTMPEGRDPDETIRSDPDLWRELIASAKPVLDHLFDATLARHDAASPRERSAAVSELLPMIAAVGDRVVQSHYLQRLARAAHVDEATLRQEMRRPRTAPQRAPRPQDAGELDTTRVVRASVRDAREEFCLALLFRYPVLRAESLDITPELFGQSENRALFAAWVEWSNEGESFEASLTPDLRPQFERVVNLDLPPFDDDALPRALRSIVERIEQDRLRLAKRASVAVVAELAAANGAEIAERAMDHWRSQAPDAYDPANDEADPAAAFVEDMEAGLKVHQRLLNQQRGTERPAR